jgi:tripartite-type tricarboxylate transporter receptor subunit TctC
MTDLISGHIQVMFDLLPQSIAQIRAGTIRAIAVTSKMRAEQLPDIPTISESIPGYESGSWFGVSIPTGTPHEIISKLNREINDGLKDLRIKTLLAEVGGTPIVFTPSEFGTLVAAETEKWAKVIRAANIKPD